MSGWLLLHVYVLVDFLDFVDVLFQNEWCFRIHIVFMLVAGLVAYICNTYMCTPRKLFRGARNEGSRDVWEFHGTPRGFCHVWLKWLLLRINMQRPSLTTVGYSGIIIHI